MKILIMDTETTGLPPKGGHWETHTKDYPYVVQIAWQVYEDSALLYETCHTIKPVDYNIPPEAAKIHGITHEEAKTTGHDAITVFRHFLTDCFKAERIVGHNGSFDTSIIKAHLLRLGIPQTAFNDALYKDKRIDTMKAGTQYMVSRGFSDKWPKLSELYKVLTGDEMRGAHNALYDVQATAECYFKLKELNFIN